MVLSVLRKEKHAAELRFGNHNPNWNDGAASGNSNPSTTPGDVAGNANADFGTTASRSPHDGPGDGDAAPGGGTPNREWFTAMFEVHAAFDTSHPTTKLSLAERELLSEVDKVISQYKLLFAHVISVVNPETGTTSRQLVYPVLTDQFTAFLRTVKLPKATVNLQSHVQAHVKLIGRSPLLMDGLSCLEPQMFDTVFALSLRKFDWAIELPTVNRESVKDLLGIYHFAKMRKGSYFYQ
jgi:hypothetical protein